MGGRSSHGLRIWGRRPAAVDSEAADPQGLQTATNRTRSAASSRVPAILERSSGGSWDQSGSTLSSSSSANIWWVFAVAAAAAGGEEKGDKRPK